MQFTPESARTVRDTADAVAAHADEITVAFYAAMFDAHPHLRDVFNRAHQATGDQPKALANSVVAFAVHLIDPSAADAAPIIRRIAHKHASLGITARDYLIVARHLLAAIARVLGDAASPSVLAAWDEVYWLFACTLIAEEARLYALGGTDPEHPWRRYRVVERIEETSDAVSLLLAPTDGDVPAHRVGQYVSVAADLPDGGRQARQYTISSGLRTDAIRITVKRVRGRDGAPDGEVSGWLHDTAVPGQEIDVSQPSGDLALDSTDDPLVLVSAGIGITPIAAIVEDLSRRQPHRTVRLFHAERSHDAHALYPSLRRQILSMTDARAQNWYSIGAESAPTLLPARPGRMDLADAELPAGARAFLCGPLPFMQEMRRTLIARGIPAERIDYEVFGPDLWPAAG